MVCAIVVTYNLNIMQFEKYFLDNKSEVNFVIIVDNSDDCNKRKSLQAFHNSSNTKIIYLESNKGIAHAQNVGIKEAKKMKMFDFILFLDQDTRLQKKTINLYKKYLDLFNKDNDIACLGVGGISSVHTRTKTIEVDRIISSGSFVPIHIFEKVGTMDEKLFIDFVEFDWCWRCLEKGYKIVSIGEVFIEHKKGDDTLKLFGREIVIPLPLRHYYQYRNFLYLLHKRYVPTTWKIKMAIKMLIKIPIYLILLNNKSERGKYILKGIRGYLLGQMGKINE